MRVLITGSRGYIGSVVAEQFDDNGDFVVHYDLKDGNDINDVPRLLYKMGRCDAVVHLAALVGDPKCSKDVKLAIETNQKGTCNVIKCAKLLHISNFIYASTCSVYGIQPPLHMADTNELQFINPTTEYAWTKYVGERMVCDAGYNVLRFGTAYGQSPNMRYDLMINAMVQSAVRRNEIYVWNRDNWRPFAHIKSISNSILLTVHGLWKWKLRNVVEFNETVEGVAHMIANVLGCKVRFGIDTKIDNRSYKVEPTWSTKNFFKRDIKEIADAVPRV